MIYKVYEDYKHEEIQCLYESVGWVNYTEKPQMLKAAYQNSLRVLAAYDNERLIGIIRVVGDGHSIIYIQDIIVDPDYQRRGIGTSLINQTLEYYSKVYQKVLLTDNTVKTSEFYKSIGFKSANDLSCIAFVKFEI